MSEREDTQCRSFFAALVIILVGGALWVYLRAAWIARENTRLRRSLSDIAFWASRVALADDTKPIEPTVLEKLRAAITVNGHDLTAFSFVMRDDMDRIRELQRGKSQADAGAVG